MGLLLAADSADLCLQLQTISWTPSANSLSFLAQQEIKTVLWQELWNLSYKWDIEMKFKFPLL